MGALRLLLALLVLLSHTDYPVLRHNVGVFAVVLFFLMSGYVMTALVRRYYGAPGDLVPFLIDRSMRLFPQFLFYLVVALAVILFAGAADGYSSSVTFGSVLLNALMLPLAFYGSLFPHALLIPQSWTLGLEAMFYIAFQPIMARRLRAVACASSIAVFLLAIFGLIDSETFAYRQLPGTLFIFLCGSYIYDRRRPEVASIWVACLVAMFAFMAIHGGARVAHNGEVLAGVILGAPLIWWLSRKTFSAVDEFLGNLSYGVYLNHYIFLMLLMVSGVELRQWPVRIGVAVAAMSMAYVSYRLVERPAIALRHRIRAAKRGDASSDARFTPSDRLESGTR